METTQMRFKDLLVSDLGPLPADATRNVPSTVKMLSLLNSTLTMSCMKSRQHLTWLTV